jgi:hypothetical protein
MLLQDQALVFVLVDETTCSGPSNGRMGTPVNPGAATKSRTRDLLITNQLLYQLSYSGIDFTAGYNRMRILGEDGLRIKHLMGYFRYKCAFFVQFPDIRSKSPAKSPRRRPNAAYWSPRKPKTRAAIAEFPAPE